MSDLAYDPVLYDEVHDEHAADVAWYTARATASGGPVLELGAGTGRTLLPIARTGVAVWGLEKPDAMRAALAARLAREPSDVRAGVPTARASSATAPRRTISFLRRWFSIDAATRNWRPRRAGALRWRSGHTMDSAVVS